MNLGQLWDQLVDCICRPPRDRYTLDDLIGGERHLFSIGPCQGIREDLELVNKRGQKLQCSHFKPANSRHGVLPCVVYCHCNSGSRRDAEEAVILLIPQGISVFCMDFAGSGLSEGDWVTLGAREVDDLEVVVNHLRSEGLTSTIGLWGRSMGAVTALMYCKRDPSIAGVVLDSPFSRLNDLMLELVQEQQIPIPRPFVRVALAAMRRSVRKRAGFDIYQVAPLQSVDEAFVPVLFGHANGDTFVKKEHSEKLHEKYAGDKNIITFDGDHNSRRPQFFYNSASIFFHNVLQVQSESHGLTLPTNSIPDAALNLGGLCLNSNANDDRARGQTNIPWDPTWSGHTPTATDFDDMLWASSANARGNESSSGESFNLGGEDCRDGNLDHSQFEGADSRWYGMLPESTIAEESMLQAALEASLQDSKQANSKDSSPGVIAVDARQGLPEVDSGTEAGPVTHEANTLTSNLGNSDPFLAQGQH